MRQVVMSDDYREAEVWPPTAFNKYLRMTRQEVKRLLIDKGGLVDIPCPACNGDKREIAFKKFGLEYVEFVYCPADSLLVKAG